MNGLLASISARPAPRHSNSSAARWWRVAVTALVTFVLVVPTAAMTSAASAEPTTYTHPDGATLTYEAEAVVGQDITITGTEWFAKRDNPDFPEVTDDDDGSVIGFKLIDDEVGQLSTTEELTNPRLGTAVTNKTVWGVAQAEATAWGNPAGAFSVTLPWPSADNAVTDPQWEAGDTFTIQVLSGTMYSDQASVDPSQRPDVSRTVALEITVVDGETTPEPGGDPSAPTITQQPVAPEAANGAEVTLSAVAEGEPAPTVQWQRSSRASASTEPTDWSDLAGETESTLTFTAGSNSNTANRWYRAVFTNSEGQATTTAVKLTIVAAPTVTKHPAGQTIDVGDTATFTAEATSTIAQSIQWQSTTTALANGEPDDSTWADVAGATAATLEVTGTDASAQHGTFYRANFTNASGTTSSYSAQLRFYEKLDTTGSVTVNGQSYGPSGSQTNDFSVSAPNAVVAGQPIVIEGTGYVHPDGAQGSVANFMVDASYSGDPNTLSTTREVVNPATGAVFSDKRSHGIAQAGTDGTWHIEIPWPDETNTTQTAEFFDTNWAPGTHHMVRILTGSLLDGDYQRGITVRFTVAGEATTPTDEAPVVTGQPADVSVAVGADATLTAVASGEPAPSVQWESSVDGQAWTAVVGATEATLTLSAVTADLDGTQYRAVFTNAAGSATSDPATLTVTEDAGSDLVRTPVLSNGQPAGTLITPAEVVVGESITISGEGWFLSDGTGGTGGPIFINQPSGGTGPVTVVDRVIENQIPDSTYADARAHGVFHSDAEGNWTITIPFPTPENSSLTEESAWQAGQEQTIRILTGSLVSGDQVRSVSVPFTLVDESTEPTDEAPVVTGQPADVSVAVGADATLTAVASGEPAPSVQWESSVDGQAWTAVVGATEATLTLSAVTADLDGTQYRAVFTNAAGSATSDPATLTVTEDAGEGQIALTHTEVEQADHVWFNLSGFTSGAAVTVNLVDTDTATVISSAPFTIGADGNTANPDGQTYRRVDVPRDATPGSQYAVEVRDASTEAVLATSDAVTVLEATTRVYNPGDHAGGEEDLLVQVGGTWTFHAAGFEPNGTLVATAVIDGQTVTLSGLGQIGDGELAWQLDDHGDTSREDYTRVQLPASVDPGDLEITFSDGTTEVTRTITVEGTVEASVTVAETAELGGTLHVTGQGFVHPTNTDQGSRIAFKIDDGAFSRLDSSIHVNRTIWYIVDAEVDGTFEADIPLPNGTTADDTEAGTSGSSPAFTTGQHTLRLLTGSLLDGDQSRTLQSAPFTVTDGSGPVEPTAPVITTQPQATSAVVGQPAELSVVATGEDLQYQWMRKIGSFLTPLVGQTQSTLSFDAVSAEDAGTYVVHVANAEGSVTSKAVKVTVTSPFTDVALSHTFVDEIGWLAASGVTTGYDDGTFRPSAPVLREQFAAYVWRLAGSPEVELPEVSPFADVPVDHVFYEAMVWLAQQGISTGYTEADGTVTFRPSQPVLREQLAAFLWRFKAVQDGADPAEVELAEFSDVPDSHVFAQEIAWLADSGITTGYDDGTYRPSQPVLREQIAAFFYRYVNGV